MSGPRRTVARKCKPMWWNMRAGKNTLAHMSNATHAHIPRAVTGVHVSAHSRANGPSRAHKRKRARAQLGTHEYLHHG